MVSMKRVVPEREHKNAKTEEQFSRSALAGECGEQPQQAGRCFSVWLLFLLSLVLCPEPVHCQTGQAGQTGARSVSNTRQTGEHAAVKSPALSDGFKCLYGGELNRALEIFNTLARERPDSAAAHYGRARALKEMGRREDAIKEFKIALFLKPADELSEICKEQLRQLGVPDNKRPSTATLSGSVSTSVPKSAATSLSKPASASSNSASSSGGPAVLRTQDAEDSINKILKQSVDRIHDIQSSSEAYASRTYRDKTDAQSKFIEQAKKEADELLNSGYGRGRFRFSTLSRDDIAQRLAELQYKSSSALDRSKSDLNQRRYEAELRSLGIKQSAEGLESQMLKKPSETSGVFLVPQGTNLYVRNYGHFDPVMPEPPEPLHAVPLKLPQVQQIQDEEKRKKNEQTGKKKALKKQTNQNAAP
jgi:tetratricopeptide (TPR) repeat protein